MLVINKEEFKYLKLNNEHQWQNFSASLDEILILFPLYKNLKSSGTVFLISRVQWTYVHSKIHESVLFYLMIYGGTVAVHLLSSAIPYLMILHKLRDCWCQLGIPVIIWFCLKMICFVVQPEWTCSNYKKEEEVHRVSKAVNV